MIAAMLLDLLRPRARRIEVRPLLISRRQSQPLGICRIAIGCAWRLR
jgi:hypothetical protein